MTDAKGFTSQTARTESLKPWMTRLRPALSTSLLDDLIRLIGEYCLSRLSWDPARYSKKITVTDADADGFGRSLQFRQSLPNGVVETVSSWPTIVSAAPLSELAGGSSVFSWAVRVDDWDGSALMVGVIRVDATSVAPEFGVHEKGHGAYMHHNAPTPSGKHNLGTWATQKMPLVEEGTVQQIRATADLTANTVRFAVEHVPKAVAGEESVAALKRIEHSSWFLAVPDLQRCHFYASGGWSMRLTLRP
jgi:hypothetical protein